MSNLRQKIRKALFNLKKDGIAPSIKKYIWGSKPEFKEVAGDKPELKVYNITNDGFYYLFEDPQLGFAGTDAFKIAFDMYRDMLLKWPHFRHLINKRKNGVVSKTLLINSHSNDERDIEVAQFVRDMLDKITEFKADIKELLDCIVFGFSISELMWMVKDGKWVIDEIRNRQQERFRFHVDQYWGLDMTGTRTEFLPINRNKFVIAQYDKEWEKPYGRGEGRWNYWFYYFQQHSLKFWAIFTEKFAMPTIMGKYPRGYEDQQNNLLKALKKFQTDQQVVIPDYLQTELLEAQRQGSLDCYQDFMRYLELSVSKNVLGQTLSSDEGRFGTRAQAEVHEREKTDVIEADCSMVAGILRDQILAPVVRFNFGEDVKVPIIEFDLEETETMKDRAATDEILVTKLGVPLDKKYFYTTYQRPEPEEKETEEIEGEGQEEKEEEEEEEGREEMGEGDRTEMTKGTERTKKIEEIKRTEGTEGTERTKKIEEIKRTEGTEGTEGTKRIEGTERTKKIYNEEEREREILKFKEEIYRKFEEMDAVAARWMMHEGRYAANAIDEGKEFYFAISDWIKEGVETAEDAGMVYNLSAETADAETRALASYLTSMIFTARLNGMWEITRLAEDKGVEFGEGERAKAAMGRKGQTHPPERPVSDPVHIVKFQEIGEYQFYPLEPTEAIEYFEGLIPLTREELEGQLAEVRLVAFTVADIQSKDILFKVRDSLTSAIRKGETFATWKKDIDTIMYNEGVSRKNPFRLRTVFDTNVHRALVAGRDRMTEDLQRRGLVRNMRGHTAGDDRVRERHTVLDGLEARVDDPVWALLNEYNCRCSKTPVLELL